MPQSPSGGGCMTPPMSPFPSVTMSINALRSKLSAIACRRSGLSKGGLSRLAIRLRAAVDADRRQFADCLRHLIVHVLQQWFGHAVPEGHVELPGYERQYRCREVTDDRILDAVEIWPALLPVIRIPRHPDVLVWLELDEFERA